MYIEHIFEPTQELSDALRNLIPQLGIHKVPPTHEALTALLHSAGATLLIARDPDEQGPIVGALCLIVYRVPTGLRSNIEDVVVDEKMRRHGIGRALVSRAIDLAREAGADGVSLTSNPQRESANQLYLSMGFELRKTNPYFFKLK